MKIACSIFAFIILAGAGMLYFLNTYQYETSSCATVVPKAFCGTVSPNYSEEARQGKSLFNANCAACHKLDAKSTGPALRFVNERFSSEDIIKFIRNDFSGTIKYTGDLGYKCTAFPNLTDDDIKNILSYTN